MSVITKFLGWIGAEDVEGDALADTTCTESSDGGAAGDPLGGDCLNELHSHHCEVNPANGLPMMDDGVLDVCGNVWGDDGS